MHKRFLIIFLGFLLCNQVAGQTAIVPIPSYTWQASQLPREFSNKLQLSFVKSTEGFPSYGTVLAGGAYSTSQDGGVFQIYFPYSVNHGGAVPKIRLGLYNNQGWSDWQSFFTSANANNENADWKAKKLVVYDNIGIGTETPSERLAVNGNIRAKEIKVEATNWPDYVFNKDYELKSLSEVERYINEHGHLPEIPKASNVAADGVSLGEMNKLLLKKVEELTLHLIEKEKEINEMKTLFTRMEELEKRREENQSFSVTR